MKAGFQVVVLQDLKKIIRKIGDAKNSSLPDPQEIKQMDDDLTNWLIPKEGIRPESANPMLTGAARFDSKDRSSLLKMSKNDMGGDLSELFGYLERYASFLGIKLNTPGDEKLDSEMLCNPDIWLYATNKYLQFREHYKDYFANQQDTNLDQIKKIGEILQTFIKSIQRSPELVTALFKQSIDSLINIQSEIKNSFTSQNQQLYKITNAVNAAKKKVDVLSELKEALLLVEGNEPTLKVIGKISEDIKNSRYGRVFEFNNMVTQELTPAYYQTIPREFILLNRLNLGEFIAYYEITNINDCWSASLANVQLTIQFKYKDTGEQVDLLKESFGVPNLKGDGFKEKVCDAGFKEYEMQVDYVLSNGRENRPAEELMLFKAYHADRHLKENFNQLSIKLVNAIWSRRQSTKIPLKINEESLKKARSAINNCLTQQRKEALKSCTNNLDIQLNRLSGNIKLLKAYAKIAGFTQESLKELEMLEDKHSELTEHINNPNFDTRKFLDIKLQVVNAIKASVLLEMEEAEFVKEYASLEDFTHTLTLMSLEEKIKHNSDGTALFIYYDNLKGPIYYHKNKEYTFEPLENEQKDTIKKLFTNNKKVLNKKDLTNDQKKACEALLHISSQRGHTHKFLPANHWRSLYDKSLDLTMLRIDKLNDDEIKRRNEANKAKVSSDNKASSAQESKSSTSANQNPMNASEASNKQKIDIVILRARCKLFAARVAQLLANNNDGDKIKIKENLINAFILSENQLFELLPAVSEKVKERELAEFLAIYLKKIPIIDLKNDEAVVNDNVEEWINEQLLKNVKQPSNKPKEQLTAEQHLRNNSKEYGFDCKDELRDGNCFFHAVADQLFVQKIKLDNKLLPQEVTYKNLRQCACDHLNKFNEKYKDHIVKDEYANIFEYINYMKQDTNCADHLAIQALSCELKLTIAIVRSDQADPIIFKPADSVGTLYLGFEVEHEVEGKRIAGHYQSLHFSGKPQKSIDAFIKAAEQDKFRNNKPNPNSFYKEKYEAKNAEFVQQSRAANNAS